MTDIAPRPPRHRPTRSDRDRTPPAPAEAEQVVRALIDAHNNHDAAAFAALFHPDGWFADLHGHRTSGRDEIRADHEWLFATVLGDAHVRVDDLQSRALAPDQAIVEYVWTSPGHPHPSGRFDVPFRNGILSAVVAREPGTGRWAIVSAVNSDHPDRRTNRFTENGFA
jgi:uncharacterized protein (TIGR02246 family)